MLNKYTDMIGCTYIVVDYFYTRIATKLGTIYLYQYNIIHYYIILFESYQ